MGSVETCGERPRHPLTCMVLSTTTIHRRLDPGSHIKIGPRAIINEKTCTAHPAKGCKQQ